MSNLKYRHLKFRLNQMSDEELEQEIEAFNPIYQRYFPVTALTTEAAISEGDSLAPSRPVLVLSPTPKT